jgi:polar amino acid transport system permease protein
MTYDWNFSRLAPYAKAFLDGALTTTALTAFVIVLGTLLGIMAGLLMRDVVGRVLLRPIIDVVRALPPLVVLLFLYFLLTEQVVGRTFSAFAVATIGLSLNLAAFVAEVVRAAIDNVEPESVEAAVALGMTQRQVTRHIIVPQVLREIIPALTVLYVGMLKATSLAAIINVREVVFTAQTVIADVARSLEAWLVVAAIYVVLVVPASQLARFLERRLGRGRLERLAI